MVAARKKILIAVDGSEQSLAGVRYLSRFIPPDRLAPVIFQVYSQIPDVFWDLDLDPRQRSDIEALGDWSYALEKYLGRFMDQARQEFVTAGFSPRSISIIVQERFRGVTRDILDEAQRGYQAVVVGAYGARTVKDLVVGSTALKILNRLTGVNLIVVSGEPVTDKVMLALDSSSGALRAVDFLGPLVAGTGRQVLLFHVVRSLAPLIKADGLHKMWTDIEDRLISEAKSVMEPIFAEAYRRLVAAGVDGNLIVSQLVSGATSRAGSIVDEANNGCFGTIALGRRGLSKVQEFFIGRVSHKVVQLARNAAVWVVA